MHPFMSSVAIKRHTTLDLPVAQSTEFYVLVLASGLPGLSLLVRVRIAPYPHRLAIVYNWCAEPFADSERKLFYSKACMA